MKFYESDLYTIKNSVEKIQINSQLYGRFEIENKLAFLEKIDLREGDNVGIICGKAINFICCLLWAIEYKANPICFPINGAERFYSQYIDPGICKIIICDTPFFHKESYSWLKCGELYVGNSEGEQVKSIDGFGQFTSGTTDVRKLVIRSWASVIDEINSLENRCKEVNNKYLNMAPLYHSYGFCGGLLWPLLKKAELVIIDTFLPSLGKKVWNESSPDIVFGLPFQYEMFLETPDRIRTIPRYVFAAGSKIKKNLIERMYNEYGIQLKANYGSTEFGTICISDNLEPLSDEGEVGSILEHLSNFTIIDEELYLYPKEQSHYFNENTTINATGDIVYINKNNNIVLKNRKRKIINVAGEKVNPEVVEREILLIEGVNGCLVFGESTETAIDNVIAVIEVDKNAKINERDILNFCKRNLSTFEVPKYIYLTERLEKSPTGKVIVELYKNKLNGDIII